MIDTMKKVFRITKSGLFHYDMRRRLENDNMTIISDNAWGAKVYRDLGLEYKTPFIDTLIFAPDYIELLNNLEHYLNSPLKFTYHSKFDGINQLYPIGILDHRVEIHFYKERYRQDAMKKWMKRKARINWDNLYIKMGDQYHCTTEHIKDFDKLPYTNKICLTAKPLDYLDSVICFSNQSIQSKVENESEYKKYFDLIKWLNTGEIIKLQSNLQIAHCAEV